MKPSLKMCKVETMEKNNKFFGKSNNKIEFKKMKKEDRNK